MDPVVLAITIVGGIIGIVAGTVQVIQYLQERREKKEEEDREKSSEFAGALPRPVIPNNLPARSEFIGREKEKARVYEALASRWPLTCIDGIGGIGKTALAREAVHECLQASKEKKLIDGVPIFDGFIWTSAKDRDLTLNDLLDTVARTLDYPGIAQQPFAEKLESVQRLLQSKRHLLVVDNFETVTDEAVRDFLLRLPEPSKALITSREQKLRQVYAVSLKGMEQSEAIELIRNDGNRLGLLSIENAEEQVLLRLYKATGGAPLAIKWAVGQIKQKGQSLNTVLASLHNAKGDIFEEIFTLSWFLLGDESRQILMVMPFFATSASKATIEAASDVHHFVLDEALGQLVEMSLVEANDELDESEQRFSIHPLTRAYARHKLEENADWGQKAEKRAAEHFLGFVTQYGRDNWRGYSVLVDELENIFAAMNWCFQVAEWRMLIDFTRSLNEVLYVYSYWRERLHYSRLAYQAAEKLQDKQAAAFAVTLTGWTYYYQGDYEQAENCARKVTDIVGTLDDDQSIDGLLLLGMSLLRQGETARASELLARAWNVAQILQGKRYIMIATIALVDSAFRRQEYNEAQQQLDKIRTNIQLDDDPYLFGRLTGFRGEIALVQGQYEEARKYFEEALAIHHRTGRHIGIAYEKRGLALVQEKVGNPTLALEIAREARSIFERWATKKHVGEMQEIIERLEARLAGEQ